jgi:hypothetical protein
MTSFKMAFHAVTKRRIVEVYDDDGQPVAVIYPSDDGSNSINIVSSYFDERPRDTVANIKDDYTLYGVHTVPGFRFQFRKD